MTEAEKKKRREMAAEVHKLITKAVRKRGHKVKAQGPSYIRVDGHNIDVTVKAERKQFRSTPWSGKFRVQVGDWGDKAQFPPRKDKPGVVHGVAIEAVAEEVAHRADRKKEAEAVRKAHVKFANNARPMVNKIKDAGKGLVIDVTPTMDGEFSGDAESGYSLPDATRVSLHFYSDITLPFADAEKLLSMMRELLEKNDE